MTQRGGIAIACLLVGIALATAARLPLVRHAGSHVDGDLAVDGLTLADALDGSWRWHYPGTPHIGTAPVLASLPIAWVDGLSASSLVAGGLVLHAVLMVACFALAWTTFGPIAAAWSVVPLAFGSTGLVWLSGRITGGHLLAAAWHAATLAVLALALGRGRGWAWGLVVGALCGLGFWVDPLALFTLIAVVVAAWFARGSSNWSRRLMVTGVFLVGFGIGMAPRIIGARVDPYDSYREQFVTIFHPINPADGPIAWKQAGLLTVEHLRILGLECLPRLVAGPGWPGPATYPDPRSLGLKKPRESGPKVWEWSALAVGLLTTMLAGFGLMRGVARSEDGGTARPSVAGLVVSSLLVLVAFVINRNIYDADNYRYLVPLVPAFAVGFGAACDGLARRGRAWLACLVALAQVVVMTGALAAWYQGFGWLGPRPSDPTGPMFAWLSEHPEVGEVEGSYWDIYPLAFDHRVRKGEVGTRFVVMPGQPERFGAGPKDGARPHWFVVSDRSRLPGPAISEFTRGSRYRFAAQAGRYAIFERADQP